VPGEKEKTSKAAKIAALQIKGTPKWEAVMHNDAEFLANLSANPADDTTRLVYADWLEEQGDPLSAAKGEFLRLTVELATPPPAGKNDWHKARQQRLQQLAAGLDTEWLAVVSRLAIENCYGKRAESRPVRRRRFRPRSMMGFNFLCDRRWEDLRPTEDQAVRFCDACRQGVHYCATITEARQHAWEGHCIALDLGVIRRDRDLEPEMMMLGRPSPEAMRREWERVQPDPVSAERERKKREGERK
jgi:uncharacterized protein (TIGR02996 family)